MSFRAVVMAGGRGSRLGAVGEKFPKALLPLGQGHVLGRLLDQLVAGGCSAVDLCLGFRADEIIARIGASWRGVPVAHWREETLLGTAGALRLVAAAASAGPADMVVINCDIVAELDFADLLARHRRYGGAASIVTARHAQTLRYGTIETPGEGCAVTGLREKPQIVHRVIAGIYLFRTQALVDALPSGDGRLDMPDLLLRFLDHTSAGMINLDLDGLWIDIGLPDDYDRARVLFK